MIDLAKMNKMNANKMLQNIVDENKELGECIVIARTKEGRLIFQHIGMGPQQLALVGLLVQDNAMTMLKQSPKVGG